MSDPPKRYPRPQTATSREVESDKARRDRARTNPFGHVVEIDPEATPPPMEAPRPETLAGLDADQKYDKLAAAVTDLAQGVAHMWPARHAVSELERVEARVEGLERGLSQYAQAHGLLAAKIEEVLRPMISGCITRLDGLEASLRKAESGISGGDREVSLLRTELAALRKEFSAIDTSNRLLVKAIEDASKRQDKAERHTEDQLPLLVERIVELETSGEVEAEVERQLTTRQKVVGVSGAAGGGVVLGEIARWIWSLFHH